MGKNLTLITADQLFKNHFTIQTDNDVVMVESLTEAKRHRYHKLKLGYLYTAMRHYRDYLRSVGKTVYYYELEENREFEEVLKELQNKNNYTKIEFYSLNNKFFDQKLKSILSDLQIEFEEYENPMFLTTKSQFKEYLDSLPQNQNLKMADFYIWQRKRLNILVDEKLKPIGGKWSFDDQNRKKLPKDIEFSQDLEVYKSEHFDSVKETIHKLFPDNPGKLDELWLPVTHKQAKQRLQDFLENTISQFGDFEDAMTDKSDFVFHSVLSPMMNIGLLTPQEILDELNNFLAKNTQVLQNNLNSIEGFVRQIIGWREWVKGMYDHKYDEKFLELNFFNSTKPLPEYFYIPGYAGKDLTENIPLHLALIKVEKLAWAHHIERLMIISNWMTINEYDPRECYEWFVSQFVDGYEWVMVANVMGMGLFADGGIFATKPYISGGNYIKKMSNYPNYDQWGQLWTNKFWEFLSKHEEFFRKQPRLSMLLSRRK